MSLLDCINLKVNPPGRTTSPDPEERGPRPRGRGASDPPAWGAATTRCATPAELRSHTLLVPFSLLGTTKFRTVARPGRAPALRSDLTSDPVACRLDPAAALPPAPATFFVMSLHEDELSVERGFRRPSRTRDWPGAMGRRGLEGTRGSPLHKPATRPALSRRNHKRAYAIARYTNAHTHIYVTRGSGADVVPPGDKSCRC